jgi:hypothetical protein
MMRGMRDMGYGIRDVNSLKKETVMNCNRREMGAAFAVSNP